MAVSEAGRRLTQNHYLRQQKIKAGFLRALLRLFGLLDPTRLDATAPEWTAANLSLIQEHWRRSAAASAAYMSLFVREETGREREFRPPVFGPEQRRAAATSLLVTGPVRIKTLTRGGTPIQRAYKLAQSEVSGAAGRHVLDGGRTAVTDPVLLDGQPLERIRYARITRGDTCWFCAMMASRGYVYRSLGGGGGSANDRFIGAGMFKFHDYCDCTLEPALDPDTPLPEANARFQNLWVEATRGLGGKDARQAFRRAVEGRSLPEDPVNKAT